MNEPTPELEAFFAGDITAEQLSALEAWINADADNARVLMRAVHFRELVGETLREQGGDAAAVLTELVRVEASVIDLSMPPREQAQSEDPGSISARELASVGGYLFRQAATSRPALLAYAAAVVLLAAVLFIPWGDEPAGPIQAQTPAPTPTPDAVPQDVATLTAQHDAQWISGAPRVGDTLHAGQTLTLTQGFAQITTHGGAAVLLEAPCTVELIDHPNALRLTSGKLVGVCHTESSRGFTVYTPDCRIIDTGTRFGVSYDEYTQARVIEGEIILTANSADAATPSTPLSAGQTARVAPDSAAVIVEPIEDQRFVTLWDAVVNKPRLEGAITFEHAMPVALGVNQTEADTIHLYLERSGFTLTDELVVTLTEPGAYDAYRNLSASVAAGRVLDSYLIHLDPPGEPESAGEYNATIRFDRPVLGIIATGDHLAQTHSTIGLAGTMYGNTGVAFLPEQRDPSGIEASIYSLRPNDRVHLSEDRRTLTMSLYCGLAIDQIRVLVASDSTAR